MSRKLRALTQADFDRLPAGCGSCAFWESAGERERRCGSARDPELISAWYRRVTDEWGDCGRIAFEDDDILGFVKYAPSGYFPQASAFAASPEDAAVPLIACMHISPDARHHGLGSVMLRSALKDLIARGERRVEAFAATQRPEVLEESPMLGMEFLLRNGFTVTRPDPHYPLMRLDLRATVTWSENLETVFESLRFPMRVPKRVPASWTDGR